MNARMNLGWVGLACLLGCVDFGVEVDPLADAGLVAEGPDTPDTGVAPPTGDAGSGDGGGNSCTEGPTDPSADGPQLEYRSLSVDKPLLVIQKGQVVTWTNGDTMRHSVVAGVPGAETPPARGGFNSGELAPSGKFAYRFCNARTAVYFCSTHPSQMNGYRVVVE